ncbi:MAG: hypothetical protein OHK0028_04340 [Deltaproteobacteria bacterium]
MQGKIVDFAVPEIFQLVSSQAKSGSLTISGPGRETVFLFADGKIVDVQPDRRDPRSLLGTMLRDAGFLTDGELKRFLASQGAGGKKLGELLVEKGKITKEVLGRYLSLQIRECLFDVLTFREGEYRFEGFAVRPASWGGEPIRPDVLLMEGMQFLDEYPQIRGKFPAGPFRVHRKRGEKIDPHALTEEERVVWKALEFSDDPDRFFRKACLTAFEGTKALALLVERGLVDVSVATPGDLSDPVQRLRREVVRLRRFDAGLSALWAVSAAAVGLWIWRAFFSPPAAGIFSAWVNFF